MRRLTRKDVEELIPYPPGKPIEEIERQLGLNKGSVIKLASNENPLGPSPMAISAIKEKLKDIHRYPDGSGFYLKEKLSQKLNIPKDRIIIGNGSNELIELVIRTFLLSEEEAIQPFPTFLVYEKIVKGAGGKIVSVPLKGFDIDLDAIYNRINSKTKIIFINNPNNPTGQAIPKKEMIDFLDSIPKDVIIILDEAYIDFVSGNSNIANGIELIDRHPLLLVIRTFSKIYGLAGLRIGYGFGSELLIDYMERVRQPFNVNTLAQAGAIAALDDNEFLSKTLEIVSKGKEYLYQQLRDMGLEYVPSVTNFFLIRVPGGGRGIYEKLLKKGIIVRSMDSYELPEYIRISVGLSEENKRFISALKEVIQWEM